MRYWMSGTDGKVYGPYDLAQLQEFVKSGRLFPATNICAEGGSSWVPAGTVPGILPAGASAQASDPSLAILIPVRVDPIALIAGYLGLFSILMVPAPFALALGIVGLVRLKSRPESKGHVRAILGIVLGSLGTILGCAVLIGYLMN